MSIPEFLERLRAIEAQWTLQGGTDIRCEKGDCPITAVAGAIMHEPFAVDEWDDAAAALDLDFDDAQLIVDAADLSTDYDVDLRVELLAATVKQP